MTVTSTTDTHDMIATPPAYTAKSWTSHFGASDTLLEVSNAKFSVKTKKGMKDILQDVSFSVEGGQLLALMGPSGAGKTTLLEYVNLNLHGGYTSGSITLNGRPFTAETFRAHAAYVEQYDDHWAFLTAREVLTFYKKLSTTKDAIEPVMKHLGLMDCADTKIGNQFLKGLSGGQKKRLSLAAALLKGPSVLLLDEPTSGLDAASTKAVMSYLLQLAEVANTIIIATIHQPATEVFMSFSKVMFLANGRLAYWDSTRNVEPYVQSLGKPLPTNTNPADHFLSLINGEFVEREEVEKVVNAWSTVARDTPTKSYEPLPDVPKMSEVKQAMVLFQRHLLLSIRDPTLYVGRMIAFLISNCFFGIIYIKSRDREQQYAIGRFFVVSWFVGVPMMFAVIVVYAVNEEFRLVKKDVRNGMSRRGAYLLARFLLQVPYMVVLALFAIVVPAYAIMSFRAGGLILTVCVMTATLWSFECTAEALAVTFANPLVGMMGSVSLWFAAFLFSGNFLDGEQVIWPFRIFTYIFPLRWSMQAVHYLDTHDTEWQGAEKSEMPPGFSCSTSPCYGYTGDQVRATLSQSFGNISAEDTVAQDLVNILLFGLFFKVVAIVMVIKRTQFSGMKLSAAPVEGAEAPSKPLPQTGEKDVEKQEDVEI